MPKVMITSVDHSCYSSPAVVVVDCNNIADAKQLADMINSNKHKQIQFQNSAKTIHRIAEVLDV